MDNKIKIVGLTIVLLTLFYIVQQNILYKIRFNEYINERQNWNLLQIKNYQYNIFNKANGKTFIFNEIVEVENGNFIDNGNFKKLNPLIYDYLTIDKIYEDIDKNFSISGRNIFTKISFGINVEYNKEYHFPQKIKYTWFPKLFAFDYGSYYMYEISNFIAKK